MNTAINQKKFEIQHDTDPDRKETLTENLYQLQLKDLTFVEEKQENIKNKIQEVLTILKTTQEEEKAAHQPLLQIEKTIEEANTKEYTDATRLLQKNNGRIAELNRILNKPDTPKFMIITGTPVKSALLDQIKQKKGLKKVDTEDTNKPTVKATLKPAEDELKKILESLSSTRIDNEPDFNSDDDWD